jgi:hypothetical protein
VNCLIAKYACIAYNNCMQYTIRNIPDALDAALRERARAENKSLNEVAVEALARSFGFSGDPIQCRDLSDLAGTWQEDPDFDKAINDQHVIDEELWK